MAAIMTGATQDDYAKMMLAGGRSVEGNRSKSGADLRAKPKARSKAKAKAKAKSAPKAKSKVRSKTRSKRG
jgi:hypothetical protein